MRKGLARLFLAANWGVAAQIYCLADGHPKVVRELFAWMAPTTPDELLPLGRFRSFYILSERPRLLSRPGRVAAIDHRLRGTPQLA